MRRRVKRKCAVIISFIHVQLFNEDQRCNTSRRAASLSLSEQDYRAFFGEHGGIRENLARMMCF